ADVDEARTALRRAAAVLARETQPDYAVLQSVAKLAELADPELREELVATPLPDEPALGALLLRADLLVAAERPSEAADALLAAARKQPENPTLVNRVQPLLVSLGRVDDAIAVYEAFVDSAAQVYPYQASQLAELYLDAGRPQDAIAALRKADDTTGMTQGALLRASARLAGPGPRAPGLPAATHPPEPHG